jgi:hypothetical protein
MLYANLILDSWTLQIEVAQTNPDLNVVLAASKHITHGLDMYCLHPDKDKEEEMTPEDCFAHVVQFWKRDPRLSEGQSS